MFKKLLFVSLFLIPALSLNAQSWKLIWADEFDGTTVDQSKWVFEQGNNNGWGNQEREYYTNRSQNAYIDNGSLVIKAIKEIYNGYDYTSARMKTQGKFSVKYGKIEARMKLPYGQGIWPAFWMLGTNISSVGWPACGEIDIMELIGGSGTRDRTAYGTAHWDDGGHKQKGSSYSLTSGKFADDYHTFALEWDDS
ncbi:MAG: family 16 glycosylhydrolase, partial [Syntrophothermus sp.]